MQVAYLIMDNDNSFGVGFMSYRGKIVVCGDVQVGKSALLERYTGGTFSKECKITLGANFLVKKIDLRQIRDRADFKDHKLANLIEQIIIYFWDIAGRRDQLRSNEYYFIQAVGAMVVFDIGNQESFNNVDFWIMKIKELCGDIPFVIIGNKLDKTNKRQVDFDKAREKAKQYNALYIETSAKSDENVDKAFENLIVQILNLLKLEDNTKKYIQPSKLSNRISKLNKSVDLRFKKMIEFEINEFLTLKSEHGKTYIYVKGKKFLQCKRLVINIIKQDIPNYDKIDSIDEAADAFKLSLWQNRIVEGPMARPSPLQNETITPEQEFWGHCSNLQTWYEHEYDTRLLHSNLAFPLLKALVDAGDTRAKNMLKTEIMERLESSHPNVIRSILSAGLLDYLSPEERWQVIQLNVSIILSHIESILKYYPNLILYVFKEKLFDYLNPEETEQLLQTNYQGILTFLQKISGFYPKTILDILEKLSLDHPSQAELKQLIQKNFPVILKDIEIIWKDIEKIWMSHPNLFLYFFDERVLHYLIDEDKMQLVWQNYPIIFKKGQEKKNFILENFPDVIVNLEEITAEFDINRISETTISFIYATIIDDIKGTKLLDDFFNAIAKYQQRILIVMLKAIRSIKTSDDIQKDIFKKWVNIRDYKRRGRVHGRGGNYKVKEVKQRRIRDMPKIESMWLGIQSIKEVYDFKNTGKFSIALRLYEATYHYKTKNLRRVLRRRKKLFG